MVDAGAGGSSKANATGADCGRGGRSRSSCGGVATAAVVAGVVAGTVDVGPVVGSTGLLIQSTQTDVRNH